MAPEKWLDLGLNLFSEVVGILVTVFLVDRVLKRREEARWKATKGFIYSRLTNLVARIFDQFLPSAYSEQFPLLDVSFGKSSPPMLIIRDLRQLDLNAETVINLLRNELADEPLRRWMVSTVEVLTAIQHEINGIINDATVFLEPEVLTILFTLRDHIEFMVGAFSRDFPGLPKNYKGSTSHRKEFIIVPGSVQSLLYNAQQLEKWLLMRTTREQNLSFFMNLLRELDDKRQENEETQQ
jgi:hypothetical protein